METLVEEYHKQKDSGSALTGEQWKSIEECKGTYLREEGKSYSWEEVKDRARKAVQ